MARWVPFEYRDFHDIPRLILARLPTGLIVMLDCPFDEAQDEYPSYFDVFLLPADALRSDDSRIGLQQLALARLGRVATCDVRLDSTGRKQLDLDASGISLMLTAYEPSP